MTSKGKRLTHLIIALGFLVLLIAGYAFKDTAVEQWYLWQLESEDDEERKVAAEKLGEMGSVKAISVILGILQRTGSEVFTIVFTSGAHAFVMKTGQMLPPSGPKITTPSEGIEYRLDADGQAESMTLVPGESIIFLLDSLWKLTRLAGRRSVPSLVAGLDGAGWNVPYLSALLLGRIGPDARVAVPALTTALRNEFEFVRHAAADALKKIQGETSR